MGLTGLSRERFDALARRDQLPLSKHVGEEATGFTWLEAVLQIATDDLCGEPKHESRSAAKNTVVAVGPAIAARWQDIVASAADQLLPEIVWVRLTHRHEDGTPQHSNIVGTQAEVGAAIASLPEARKIDGGSATASAAILLDRAEKNGFVIPDEFWTEAPIFIADDDSAVRDIWSRAVDEAAKRKAN
ncbi:hypothetical protein FDV58_37735 [Bradyrhizobium elkanii]|uniref:Uncharacterized protein n=1 Tax=Bradyrhizobium elkanii TaxID=29448 RepID=A0A4U6RGS8_BRAEL|nr:hypothetical protein [Bradyrhizobium elkanii]TKV73299.1 hypothetical protein FDV58_37735 [Bradyrhizobium elkanii]